MKFNDEDLSNKSQMVALVLCLAFGQLGAHRFYVGRYISGVLYLIVGGTSIVLNVFGFNYAMIASLVYAAFMLMDVYALYSDSFSDSKGRLLTDSKALVYNSLQEREELLFNAKLNKILVTLLGLVVYIVYLLLSSFVF